MVTGSGCKGDLSSGLPIIVYTTHDLLELSGLFVGPFYVILSLCSIFPFGQKTTVALTTFRYTFFAWTMIF